MTCDSNVMDEGRWRCLGEELGRRERRMRIWRMMDIRTHSSAYTSLPLDDST